MNDKMIINSIVNNVINVLVYKDVGVVYLPHDC